MQAQQDDSHMFWGGSKGHPARLTFVEAGEEKRLGVSKVDLHGQIVGDSAEVTITMTFRNPIARQIEGELVLPMPEGATVCSYAMDINGRMVEAIPVEKEEARVAFQQEVAKGNQAGLVEEVKGNSFRTRVYPIPASGEKTVRVRYAWQLGLVGDADADKQLVVIPLQFEEKVEDFRLQLQAINTPQPSLDANHSDAVAADLSFRGQGQTFVAETSKKNVALNRPLVLAVPSLATAKTQQVILESHKDLEEDTEDVYFRIVDFPEIAANAASSEKKAKAAHKRIGVIWDASLSRAKQDSAREISLLEAIVERELAATQNGSVDVDIYLLRNVLEKPRTFDGKGGAGKIGEYLQQITLDGGTNTTAIAAPRVKEGSDDDVYSYFCLFTDGLGNFGEAMPTVLSAPVFAFSNAANANSSFLSYVAAQSGGCYYNLLSIRSNDVILPSIGQSTFGFISAEFDENEISDVLPSRPQPIVAPEGKRGKFVLFGKLRKESATITLHYGIGTNITHSETVRLSSDQVGPSSGLISRQWARKKVDELSLFAEKNKEDIIALGRKFGFVTPGTSLLILQDIEQYRKYNIIPPLTLPELREQYLKEKQEKEDEILRKRDAKAKRVAEQMWKPRVEWWNTEFKPQPVVETGAHEALNECVACPPPPGGAPLGDGRLAELPPPAPMRSMQCQMQGPPARSSPSPSSLAPLLSQAASMCRQSRVESDGATNSSAYASLDMLVSADEAMCDQEERRMSSSSSSSIASSPSPSAPPVGPVASIKIKAWDPDTPYLKEMKKDESKAYAAYLEARKEYGESPAFFLDCSEFFFQRNDRKHGLRVLTNVLELGIDDPQLYRIVGYKLDQYGELEPAQVVFEKVLALRPKEPQSHRDLALVVAKRKDYQRALDLFNEVVVGEWEDRFDQIEVTALVEANRVLKWAEREGVEVDNPIDSSLIHPFDLDVRISMAWDTDRTDIDLHVIEPSGEEAYFAHNLTAMGGKVSRDFTQGYGPEEYMIKKAMPGTYKVRAKYYSSHAQTLSGGTTVLLSLFTNYARPGKENYQLVTVRLQTSHDLVDIGEITFTEEPKEEPKQNEKKAKKEDKQQEEEEKATSEEKQTGKKEKKAKSSPGKEKGKEAQQSAAADKKGKKKKFLFF